jgi:hypothetical protein
MDNMAMPIAKQTRVRIPLLERKTKVIGGNPRLRQCKDFL